MDSKLHAYIYKLLPAALQETFVSKAVRRLIETLAANAKCDEFTGTGLK
jgi:hypothetical protein